MSRLEDLLKIASDGDDSFDPKDYFEVTPHKSVEKFISELKIVVGTHNIPTYLLYYIYYRRWRHKKVSKLAKVHFFREFSKVFKPKRTGKLRYYKLNNIGLELKEEARLYDRRFFRKKKKIIEKTSKVSGTIEAIQPKS